MLFALFPVHALLFTTHHFAIVFWAVLSSRRLSLSFLQIGIHGRIPAFSWVKTGRPKICAAALEVLNPLKLLSQNMHTALLVRLSYIGVICNYKILLDNMCCLASGCSRFNCRCHHRFFAHLVGKNGKTRYKPFTDSRILTHTSRRQNLACLTKLHIWRLGNIFGDSHLARLGDSANPDSMRTRLYRGWGVGWGVTF